MRTMFHPDSVKASSEAKAQSSSSLLTDATLPTIESVMELVTFASDDSSDEWDSENDENDEDLCNTPIVPPLPGPVAPPHGTSLLATAPATFESAAVGANARAERSRASGLLPRVPPLKRRKLDISYRAERELRKQGKRNEREKAWDAIRKILASKKTNFVSGHQGLQARRAKAIECLLRLVIKSERSFIDASQISAEAHYLAVANGSR